jgi:5-methylcytosine-specific restriction endonuclease McrA
MGKAPAEQFYWGDYIRDTRSLNLMAKGAWSDILAHGFFKTPFGRISQSLDDWATMFGCDAATAKTVLEAIKKHQVGDVDKERNGDITVTNRRRFRDWQEKQSGAERQARFRERGGGNPEKWTALRAIVLVRDEKMCAYCGRKATTVDHVIPRSRGGEHDPRNLVACCKTCNSVKSNRTPVEAGMRLRKGFNHSVLSLESQGAAGFEFASPSDFESNAEVTPISSSSSSSSTSLKRLIATCVREHASVDERLVEIAVLETLIRRKGSANENQPIKSAKYFNEEIVKLQALAGKDGKSPMGDQAIEVLLRRRREQVFGGEQS